MTCAEIAYAANIESLSATIVYRIITTMLNKRKILAQWVPHALIDAQKEKRVSVARTLLDRYTREGERFLRRIVAIDETWILDYEPESKQQSTKWRATTSSRPTKFRRQQTRVKQLVILVCNRVSVGTTVTRETYAQFLSKALRPRIRKIRPELLARDVLLLHNNARPHLHDAVLSVIDEYG
ncbi:hypothetical protein PGB90_005225 [Kerria lacca]